MESLLSDPHLLVEMDRSRPQRRLHITCAVGDCHSPKTGVSYHRFPKERNLNKRWRILCRVGDVKEPRICSRHFLAEDFKRDLVNELLNLPQKKLLNSDALPSLYLFKNQKEPPQLTSSQIAQKEEEERRQRDELIERLLTKGPDPPPIPIEPKYKHVGVQVFEFTSSEYQSQLSKLNSLNKKLLNTIEQQKIKINELRSSVRKMQSSKYVEPLLRETPQMSFTKSQTDVILHKKKVRKWLTEDIISALRLRQMSPKTYAFIRRCGHFPLPGLSTLRNWVREFKVEKGSQEIAWAIIKERLRTEKDPKFKLATLVFDEIECRNDLHTLGTSPFPIVRKMQVVLLRGLFHKWKYIIYQDLDFPITKLILDQLIVKAEEIGVQVWALSLSIDNKEVMEEVILKNSCFTFSNPIDESRHIYIFPSMSSMILQLRNYVFDMGIILNPETQTILCKRDFELILSESTREASTPKFRNFHLNACGIDRRRNKLALQTFSLSVSKSMETIGIAKEKVDTIRKLNAYVDVFNSRSKTFNNKIGSAFGVHLEEQKSTISEAEDLAIKLRVIDPITGKPEINMMPFQYGMIIGIQSLTELYNELVVRRNALDFIPTGHLSTDVINSYLHMMGGYLGFLEEFEPEEIFKKSRLVMIGRKIVPESRPFLLDSVLDEDMNIDPLEPLFGALPIKTIPKKKRKASPRKKSSVKGGVQTKRKRKMQDELHETQEKLKRIESIENSIITNNSIINLPPEIYTF
ncbi:uncharacterized protein [Lepeophtheirus salmonis]|nr:uncharacterized protein LOC121124073 [Lepeophtheirus salmonis]